MALHVPDLLVNNNELFVMTVFAELKRHIEIQNSTASQLAILRVSTITLNIIQSKHMTTKFEFSANPTNHTNIK